MKNLYFISLRKNEWYHTSANHAFQKNNDIKIIG